MGITLGRSNLFICVFSVLHKGFSGLCGEVGM